MNRFLAIRLAFQTIKRVLSPVEGRTFQLRRIFHVYHRKMIFEPHYHLNLADRRHSR